MNVPTSYYYKTGAGNDGLTDDFIQASNEERIRIKSLMIELTTDATSADREVVLQLKRSTTVIWQIRTGAVQPASKTYKWTFMPGIDTNTTVATDTVMTRIPEIVLQRDDFLNITIVNGQAGDSWSYKAILEVYPIA